MSYGTYISDLISSDSVESIEIPLDNNADIFNLMIKPSEEYTSGRLYIQVKNTANDIWETVFTHDGRRAFLCTVKPRAVTLKHVSLHAVKLTPDSMDSGKTYQVTIDNLSSWSDG